MVTDVAKKTVHLHAVFFPNRCGAFSLSSLDSKNNPLFQVQHFLFCFVLIYKDISAKSVLLLTFGLN